MSGTCEICFGRMGSLVDTKRGGRQKDWNSTRRGWEELLGNAEGGADKLHNKTKSRLWRGGAQVIDDVLEDEQPLKRERECVCVWSGKNRKIIGKLIHHNTSWRTKSWKNKGLQLVEGALRPMTAMELKRAASSFKASTGVGADGFHRKVPLG